MTHSRITRRALLSGAAALLAAPALAQRAPEPGAPRETAFHNVMGFRTQQWQAYFDTLSRGAILCDMDARVLHFWDENDDYRLYPTSVPLNEDFARRGYTEITLLRRAPVWVPTPTMRALNPELPARVEAGPENPMGTRAMNLGWPYYRIHGIDDVTKIGRRASNGCIGLMNPHVEDLFERVQVGTPVLLI